MSRPDVLPFGRVIALFLLAFSAFAQAQTVTYFHNDAAGSPLLATDAAGAIVWKETYRPYGERLVNAPAEAGNPIGYAGKPFDAATGLSYLGARYYDPGIGRFAGVDPAPANAASVHGFNRYVYANNNPYKYVDPDGHSPLDVTFLLWDIGKLGVAIYSGVGIGVAAADVGWSSVGVLSPIPGVGQVLKAARVVRVGVIAASQEAEKGVADGSGKTDAGANLVVATGTSRQGGGDDDKSDKQKKGKPERNVDQNKRVDDAARETGLDKQQRRELGRYIEQGSRKYGENSSYRDILDAAERIKGGEKLINIK